MGVGGWRRFCAVMALAAGAIGCRSADPGPTQVVIIATQHFITDQPDGYTSAHLRALLTRINPNVLAVEAAANVPQPWESAPLDLAAVTRPWAAEHHIPAEPVGFNDALYEMKLARMFNAISSAGRDAEYRQIESQFQLASARQGLSCQQMNSPGTQSLWRRYHRSLHALYGQDTPWEQCSAQIAQNILGLCRQHPGERVAVVFGGAHAYYIADALAGEADIEVLPTVQFLPLTEAEVAAQRKPIDHLLALRPLNFPTLPPDLVAKLQKHLDELRTCAELSGDYHLFQGKMFLHQRLPQEALAEFDQVAALSPAAISAFDGKSRLCDSGVVNAAIVRRTLGQSDRAKSDLETLLKRPDLPAAARQWAQRVLDDLPK